MLAGDDNGRSIEEIASQSLGRPLTLRVSGATDGGAAGPAAPVPAPGVSRSTPSAEAGESRHELTERARKDPGISRVLSEFGAQVVDVRPLRPAGDDAAIPPTLEENG
jgi:hypothetical protein